MASDIPLEGSSVDPKLEEKAPTGPEMKEESNDTDDKVAVPLCTESQIQSILAAAGQGVGDDEEDDANSRFNIG